MHELSIAQSILSIAEKSVPPGSKEKVVAVTLQVGELSSIETEALLFAFDAIKSNTILQHAEMKIETIPGEAVCNSCHNVFHLNSYATACPNCNSYSVSITKGKEMKIVSLTMED
ncbi:MAG: hydrogenase maturation nickel metallochaperone HypA [Lacibacter sp.]